MELTINTKKTDSAVDTEYEPAEFTIKVEVVTDKLANKTDTNTVNTLEKNECWSNTLVINHLERRSDIIVIQK